MTTSASTLTSLTCVTLTGVGVVQYVLSTSVTRALANLSKMWAGVAEAMEDPKAWLTVAAEAEDSRWFDQVPNRAKRLTARFRALG